MENPKDWSSSIMSILRGRGVQVVGILVACFLFQGFINFSLGKIVIETYENRARQDSLTIDSKEKQIEFFKNFLIEDSKASRMEAKELRERNQTLLDSLIRFNNHKNDKDEN